MVEFLIKGKLKKKKKKESNLLMIWSFHETLEKFHAISLSLFHDAT